MTNEEKILSAIKSGIVFNCDKIEDYSQSKVMNYVSSLNSKGLEEFLFRLCEISDEPEYKTKPNRYYYKELTNDCIPIITNDLDFVHQFKSEKDASIFCQLLNCTNKEKDSNFAIDYDFSQNGIFVIKLEKIKPKTKKNTNRIIHKRFRTIAF